MQASEQVRFGQLYAKHLEALKLHGKADKTIDSYARAVRRVARVFDRCPDDLTVEELQQYFADLIDSHSWSTIKIDRNGLRFFHEQVLARNMPWLELLKAPKVQSLPDIPTQTEIARIILGSRELRYQSFWWMTYSMGLARRKGKGGARDVIPYLIRKSLRLFARAHAQGVRTTAQAGPRYGFVCGIAYSMAAIWISIHMCM